MQSDRQHLLFPGEIFIQIFIFLLPQQLAAIAEGVVCWEINELLIKNKGLWKYKLEQHFPNQRDYDDEISPYKQFQKFNWIEYKGVAPTSQLMFSIFKEGSSHLKNLNQLIENDPRNVDLKKIINLKNINNIDVIKDSYLTTLVETRDLNKKSLMDYVEMSSDQEFRNNIFQLVVCHFQTYAGQNKQIELLGKSFLCWAIFCHQPFSFIKQLIERGAALDQGKHHPIHAAAQQGLSDIVEYLLEKKPSEFEVKDFSFNGWTPLDWAVARGHVNILQLLLAHDKDNTYFTDQVLVGTYLRAAQAGKLPVIEFLLKKDGTLLNKTGALNYTALIFCCANGHINLVKYLLSRKVDLTHAEKHDPSLTYGGWTAFHWAAKNGHVDIVQLLLAHDKDNIYFTDKVLVEAYLLAVEFGQLNVVMELLKCDRTLLNRTIELGWTALHEAARKGHVNIVQLLLVHDKDNIYFTDKVLVEAYLLAAREGNLAVVEFLLKRDHALLNKTDSLNQTAFIWACANGHKELVEYLLSYFNLDLTPTTTSDPSFTHGGSALDWAEANEHKEIVYLILESYYQSKRKLMEYISQTKEKRFVKKCSAILFKSSCEIENMIAVKLNKIVCYDGNSADDYWHRLDKFKNKYGNKLITNSPLGIIYIKLLPFLEGRFKRPADAKVLPRPKK